VYAHARGIVPICGMTATEGRDMNSENISISIAENSLECLILFDRMGAVYDSNDGAALSLGYQSLTGVQIADIFPSDFKVDRDGIVTTLPQDGNKFETLAYRQNKTCFDVRGRLTLFANNGYALHFIDISHTVSLEKELSSLKENTTDIDKMKNEFVANVTHELRTPVNGILGNTHELMSHNLSDEDMRILGMIERGCEDMNALINNILDFSKLEAGKFQLEPREFNFRNMVEYVRMNHINKIREKGLEFFCTVSEDIPEKVIGDELRIVQILNNLLSNACKFTHVGRIMMEAVATAREGRRIEIFFMIMDTGIGIDKKNQDKLFKSFSQVEASISRRFGGTGLGLNISKQLVNLMGGHINVESELGKGTTFTFSAWLELPEGETVAEAGNYVKAAPVFNTEIAESMERTFGTKENIAEINNRLTKLALCLEMNNWEKAETFSDAIKALSDGAPREVSSQVLRLKMAVQKENKDRAIQTIDVIRNLL